MFHSRRPRAVFLVLAAVGWIGLAAAAGSSAERLYVLVSPLDSVGPSSIVAFDIMADGLPEQVDSWMTGGTGRGFTSAQPLAVDAGGRFLFAAHNESSDLAVLRIDAQGGLAPVSGSPFPVSSAPAFLATHPVMERLYVPEFFGRLCVHEFDADGALGELQCLDAGPQLRGVAVDPAGNFLHVVTGFFGEGSVRSYSIGADGTLAELSSSPLAVADSRLWDLEISADGGTLYAHDLDLGVFGFEVGAAGGLTRVAGSPFPIGTFSQGLALTPDGVNLYSTAPFDMTVYGFRAAADGSLTATPDSPFPGDNAVIALLPSALDPRLYLVGRDTHRITSFDIDPDGRLFDLGPQVDVADPTDRVPNGALLLGLVLEVDLDIKPGSRSNPVNPRATGVIPVAILGGADLDVRDIDVASLRLGLGAAQPAHSGHLQDVNSDAALDLLLHFRTADSAIACGDTQADLTGVTSGGRGIHGTDVIVTRGCK